jgi:hypothetical protein
MRLSGGSTLDVQDRARRDLTLAWASVALKIVDLVAMMFAGEGAAEKGDGLAPALVVGIGGGWFALTNLVGLIARIWSMPL